MSDPAAASSSGSIAPIRAVSAMSEMSVFVSGGASGLGRAICAALVDAGARVMIGDINGEQAQEVATSINADKSRVCAVACDVGDPASAQQAINATIEAFGGLDVLINNAGTDKTCAIDELTVEEWERVLRTNLSGPFLLTRCALPTMKQAGSGQIINIASTAAKRAWPNASAYHASKWGLLGLSHAMHAELRSHNIKVTAVIAGGMRTPFLLDRFPEIDLDTLQDPANVAQAVLAVLSMPKASVIPEIMVLPMRESSWP